MPTTLIITNGRLSFDKNLFEPSDAKLKKSGKFSCNIIASDETTFAILTKDRGKVVVARKDLDKVLQDVLKEKFNKVPAKWENWATRENTAAVNATSGDRYKGYEDDNGIYFSPSRYADQGHPSYVRRDRTILNGNNPDDLAEAKRLFYGGCYINAKINIAAFEVKEDNVTKRGVTSFLEAVQFLRDGDKFGGGSANADGFDAVDEDDLPDGLDDDSDVG